MKKKLLTVLLAVVMVFGVFGLTACGGSNADADYNYYAVKYEIEDEIKIQAATFQGVYKMFTTTGNFLLYVESGEDKADFQAINKLANDWDVTIYHFNPDLTGGYAKNLSNAVDANLLTLSETAYNSQMGSIQDLLVEIAGVSSVSDLKDGNLWAIRGGESTASADGKLQYKGSLLAQNPVADAHKSIVTICSQSYYAAGSASGKLPSFGAYTEEERDVPEVPAAYNTAVVDTINLFADARLHMYDEAGDLTAEKEDVYVTVANYEMFAHLMDNNEGYFPVFFGGTWCGNTQAIAKLTDEIAKQYAIEKIYFFDPRLDDGVRLDVVSSSTVFSADKLAEDEMKADKLAAELVNETDPEKIASLTAELKALAATAGYTTTYSVTENSKNITGNLNTRAGNVTDMKKSAWDKLDAYSQALLMAEQATYTVTTKVTGHLDTVEVFTLEDLGMDLEAIADAAVIAKANELAAADADLDKAIKAANTEKDYKALKDDADAYALAVIAEYNKDAKTKVDVVDIKAKAVKAEYDKAAEAETVDQTWAQLEAAAKKAYNKANKSAYNYNFTYGQFLADYLDTYKSEWNIVGSNNNITITLGNVDVTNITRMCVPNIMMFNGEKADAKAELVALAEAEYQWVYTSEEGTAEYVAWSEAVKSVFDANPYATYTAPVAETPAADASASASAGSTSSAPAASAGSSDAC